MVARSERVVPEVVPVQEQSLQAEPVEMAIAVAVAAAVAAVQPDRMALVAKAARRTMKVAVVEAVQVASHQLPAQIILLLSESTAVLVDLVQVVATVAAA